MKSRYKFYLDETLVEDPDGWEDIHSAIKQDKDLNGLLLFIDATLLFYGKGYTYLRDKFYSVGFCGTVELKILELCQDSSYQEIHKGIVRLSRVEINERLCNAKIKPDDNSFYAKIDKNRNKKAFLWAGLSKSEVAITPATLATIEFFNPADGSYYPVLIGAGQEYSCKGYTAYEVFKYLIAFMSDGEVEFDSSLFGAGGEFEGLILTVGTVLFTVQTGLSETVFKEDFPDVSFEDFFKEVYKRTNIGFYFDYSGKKPKMIIERTEDIPTGTDAVTFDNIDEITTKISTDRIYGILKIGSTITNDALSLSFPEGIDWLGFKEEQYNLLGECGEDKTLDLVGEYVVSSNVIEDTVVTPSDQYVEELFLINCEHLSGTIYRAKQSNNLTGATPPYFYNQDLINSEIAKRFLGAVPSSVAKFLGTGTSGKFLASKTTTQRPPNAYIPITFEDDFNAPNFDDGNNYNITNSRYTFPGNGLFVFETNIHMFSNIASGLANYSVNIQVWDSAFTTLITEITMCDGSISVGSHIVSCSASIFGLTGQKVRVVMSSFAIDVMPTGSNFACVQSVTGGGIYQTYDPKDYSALVHEFEYPISNSQYNALKNNPRGNVVFAMKGQELRRARIDTIDFNRSGTSRIKLISTINDNQNT